MEVSSFDGSRRCKKVRCGKTVILLVIDMQKALVDEEGDGRYLFKNLSEECLNAH